MSNIYPFYPLGAAQADVLSVLSERADQEGQGEISLGVLARKSHVYGLDLKIFLTDLASFGLLRYWIWRDRWVLYQLTPKGKRALHARLEGPVSNRVDEASGE